MIKETNSLALTPDTFDGFAKNHFSKKLNRKKVKKNTTGGLLQSIITKCDGEFPTKEDLLNHVDYVEGSLKDKNVYGFFSGRIVGVNITTRSEEQLKPEYLLITYYLEKVKFSKECNDLVGLIKTEIGN